jgi:GNAT superfamily N-acetyltransferase
MSTIRPCREDERPAILEIVNTAAEAYRGVIPADRWHEPYMRMCELEREVAVGVAFWGYEADGVLLGIMGIQPVGGVDLIRHAYVSPGSQGHGIGGALLAHLTRSSTRRILVGTWAAAEWAIRFYRRHGFELVPHERKAELLRTHWTIPDRQIETSVVLAKPPLAEPPTRRDGPIEEAGSPREGQPPPPGRDPPAPAGPGSATQRDPSG